MGVVDMIKTKYYLYNPVTGINFTFIYYKHKVRDDEVSLYQSKPSFPDGNQNHPSQMAITSSILIFPPNILEKYIKDVEKMGLKFRRVSNENI